MPRRSWFAEWAEQQLGKDAAPCLERPAVHDGLFIVSIADRKLIAAVTINHLSSVSDKDGQVLQLRTITNHLFFTKNLSPMVHLTVHDLDSIRLPKCAMGIYLHEFLTGSSGVSN